MWGPFHSHTFIVIYDRECLLLCPTSVFCVCLQHVFDWSVTAGSIMWFLTQSVLSCSLHAHIHTETFRLNQCHTCHISCQTSALSCDLSPPLLIFISSSTLISFTLSLFCLFQYFWLLPPPSNPCFPCLSVDIPPSTPPYNSSAPLLLVWVQQFSAVWH